MTTDQKVSGKCKAELFDLKQQLMEDYSINPEIVANCDVEIMKHCNKGTMKEGKTIDCLMDLAEENEGKDDVIRPQCFKAVSSKKRKVFKILFFLIMFKLSSIF